jgi:hypothetical protein
MKASQYQPCINLNELEEHTDSHQFFDLEIEKYGNKCKEVVEGVSKDERFRWIEAPAISLKEFYDQNNITYIYKDYLNKTQLQNYF